MPSVLTSLANLKRHLGIPASDAAEDTFLQQTLVALDQVVLGWTGRKTFASAAATEYFDGTGRETLCLARRPVTAIAGVWVDGNGRYGYGSGAFPSSSAWNVGEHFVPRSLAADETNAGLLQSIRGEWPEGRGNIKVTYTAGYATIPPDIELAVHQLAAIIRESRSRGMVLNSETIGKYSYALLSGAKVPGQGPDVVGAAGSLNRYRETHF